METVVTLRMNQKINSQEAFMRKRNGEENWLCVASSLDKFAERRLGRVFKGGGLDRAKSSLWAKQDVVRRSWTGKTRFF